MQDHNGACTLSTRGRSDLAIATPADQVPRRAALARVKQKACTITHPKLDPIQSRGGQILFGVVQVPIYGDQLVAVRLLTHHRDDSPSRMTLTLLLRTTIGLPARRLPAVHGL